eukprot:COSAG01_NODE_5321_length_4335_cov_3.928234_7_plen_157_part_00
MVTVPSCSALLVRLAASWSRRCVSSVCIIVARGVAVVRCGLLHAAKRSRLHACGVWVVAGGGWPLERLQWERVLCVEPAAFACLRAILLAYLFFFFFLVLVLLSLLAVSVVCCVRNCSAVPRRRRPPPLLLCCRRRRRRAAAPLPFAWFGWCVLRV